MLLAEANQWPADAASYFGDGDECHMNFHFPLMPRMFMAIHLEDAFPIVDILDQTPAIPESCQWATFLRNHDELTLEMVTEEDRDYMYRVYARDHRARLNLGIRRRLAPLLGDRRRLELLNALLFSLPGTPVLYYGDEIGMGDNIYLGDRDGVRTPMQWNSDRNAGFSRANPQRLYLPVVVDPQFHFEAVNVETQQADPASLLWWMKYLIDLRTSRPVFSRGSLRFLEHDNAKVLAFVRELEGDQVLFVANLSRFAQYVTLFMGDYQGKQPFEMRGRGRFPRIEAERWGLSLGPYDHIWLDLRTQAVSELPARQVLSVQGPWWRVFEQSSDEVGRILAEHLQGRAWFRASGNDLVGQSLLDSVRFECEADCFVLLLSQLEGVGGQREIYGLPVGFAVGAAAPELGATGSVIAELTEEPGDGAPGQAGVVFDATTTRAYASQLLESLRRGRSMDGQTGSLRFEPRPGLEYACSVGSLDPRGLDLDQRVVFFGAQVVLKLLRVADEGVNAETEMLDFLSAHGARRLAPTLLGTVTWCGSNREALLAIATEHVQNRGTAWAIFADALQGHLERVLSLPDAGAPHAIHPPGLGAPLGGAPSLAEPLPYLVDLLARRTAELHRTLSTGALDPAFAPEPFDHLHQQSLFHSARSLVTRTFAKLRGRLPALVEAERAQAARVLVLEDTLVGRLRTVATGPLEVLRIRSHGDLGLGDALFTGDDFVFIDFEGESARPLSERRYKRCVLRDVAGVVRSIELLGGAMLEEGRFRIEDAARLRPWMDSAATWLASRFVETHSTELDGTGLIPSNVPDRWKLLRFYLFERCVHELAAALHSSASLTSALTGLERLLGAVSP
jgi:maltose alpha-D-glucosyltransferase/alpha-amylase